MTTTDFKFQICLGTVPETSTYTIHRFWKSVTETLRSNYVPTHKTPRVTSQSTKEFDCPLLVISQITETDISMFQKQIPSVT